MNNLYNELENMMRKLTHLRAAESVLNWDLEVKMPSGANEFRAQQLATLASMSHEMFTDKRVGKLLKELLNSPLWNKERRNVEILWEDYEENRKLPSEYVQRSTVVIAESYEAWVKARQENDFASFAPHLKKVIELQKEWTKLIGWKGKAYDAMLENYEKGLRMENLDKLFVEFKGRLLPLIQMAQERTKTSFPLKGMFPEERQFEYSLALLEKVGFDLKRGRLDTSPHPFSTAFHPTDSRITTAIHEKDLSSIWSTLHEAGHGMYEQGLNAEESHMPSGWAQSLSLHESQSRFWENVVGKSFTFWRNEFPALREFFKTELHDMTPEEFWLAASKVEPRPIRIDADELTYHLHIIIRYEIEKAIFEEDFPIEMLPKLWNEKYKEYLGIEIADDSQGILQDVHWSHGMFGYFPTYTLGSLYAAQFYQRMKSDIDVVDKIFKEDYSKIKEWLQENVHSKGGIYSAEEICILSTKEPLNISHFVNYITEKYSL